MLVQILTILFLSAVLAAPILQWRARKLQDYHLTYKDASILSMKAGFIAVIVRNAFVIALALMGIVIGPGFKILSILLGVIEWWFFSSNAILKLDNSNSLLTVKDARSISTSTLICFIAGILAFNATLIIIYKVLISLKVI